MSHKNDENSSSNLMNEVHKTSGTFKITVTELEELMGAYKERGSEFRDIKAIEKQGGINSILNKLKTDPKKGFASIDNRENDFGSNKVFVEPVPPFCAYVCEALEDLMVRILIIAAIIQIILGATLSDDPSKDWVDGFSIVIAVLVVTLVGSITNWKKETKFHELNDIQNEGTKYKVIRNGNPSDLPSDDLLVGDLINIMIGDIMPADLLLVEGNGIKMDESALTGESDTLKKEVYEKCVEVINKINVNENKADKASSVKPPSPFLLSGTSCVEGTGLAIVIAVGDHSQKGIIRRTVDNAQENAQTPLEQKLDDIATSIGWFGMAAGVITLVALFIRFGVNYVKDQKEYKKSINEKGIYSSYVQNNNIEQNNTLYLNVINQKLTNPKSSVSNKVLDIILLCVSIIVVAIPEGLPLAVTLSLAFSIKKLMDQNNLVRKMHACETMGGANYICTDKTGTLTKNEMNVFKVLTAKNEIMLKETIDDANAGNLDNKNKGKEEKKMREEHTKYFQSEEYWDLLKLSIALNIDGTIKYLDTPNINGDTEICETKNKTDNAFIDFLYRFKSPISVEKKTYLNEKDSYHQIPFDSKRKRMTTFVKNSKFPTGYRLFTKGGAENVKKFCKYYIDPENGEKKNLEDQQKNFISDSIENFNKQMLRSLYTCYKDISKDEYDNYNSPEHSDIDTTDCIFICCVGIRDSLRNGVKEAVIKCHAAGVNVIMVTGDNIVTATAIAKDCHILGPEVDLNNMKPGDIEEDPDSTNDEFKRDNHLAKILSDKPKAITGNTFYKAIGGLVCQVCTLDTNLCKCPKTSTEAETISKKTGEPPKEVKNDTIKNKNNFISLVKNLRVMARSQPIHKYALVLGLRELGKIVAVTGDGTNDAPALSKSDVGFAMFAGTDIAKEASDIIIIDNNFSSIVVAIIYGRNIYDNIRKFLQFQLTVNFCACLLVFICACIGNESPLTTIQMLWINLIMDSLGSLALATEPPYNELLNREPTKRDESIINGKMWKHIIIQSLFQLGLLLFLYLHAPHFIKEYDYVRISENYIIRECYGKMPGGTDIGNIIYGTVTKWSSKDKLLTGKSEYDCGLYSKKQDMAVAFDEYVSINGNTAHMTIVFNVFVIYTLFNQINARVLDDSFNIFVRITDNFFFPVITIGELCLQILIVEIGKEAFKVTERGLTWKQWFIVFGFSAITFVLCFIIKLIPIDVAIQSYLDNKVKQQKEEEVNENANNNQVPLKFNSTKNAVGQSLVGNTTFITSNLNNNNNPNNNNNNSANNSKEPFMIEKINFSVIDNIKDSNTISNNNTINNVSNITNTSQNKINREGSVSQKNNYRNNKRKITFNKRSSLRVKKLDVNLSNI